MKHLHTILISCGLQAQVNKWEGKEKERVRLNLEDSCKKQMK